MPARLDRFLRRPAPFARSTADRRATGRRRRALLGLAATLALGLGGATALPAGGAEETVVVLGGYHFPPYVESGPSNGGGLSLALMDALNSLESPYRFKFFKTSPARRHVDFQRGRYDVAFLESPAWGWRQRDIAYTATPPLLRGREVYVARAEAAARDAVFAEPAARSLAGFIGYHYAVTGMETDPERLRTDYDIMLNTSHERNLQALHNGRVDLAIVTEAFLERYRHQHPDIASALAVGPEPDHTYTLRGLVSPSAPIEAATLTRLLARLSERGDLDPILARFKVAEDWRL